MGALTTFSQSGKFALEVERRQVLETIARAAVKGNGCVLLANDIMDSPGDES
jgi:hypothetical protein